jgi:hypothetical protein
VLRLRAIPEMRVTAKVGAPASAAALARCAKVVGAPLPPSLRTYLATQDGATVRWRSPAGTGALEVLGASAIAREKRALRAWLEADPAHALEHRTGCFGRLSDDFHRIASLLLLKLARAVIVGAPRAAQNLSGILGHQPVRCSS